VAGDLALLVAACALMRGAGLAVAGRLSADHPVVRWAASVALATLAAFVALAVAAPTGALAAVPLPARAAGLAVALGLHLWRGGLLLPVLGGVGAAGLLWAARGNA
jgi:hypothetical protein